MVGGEGVKCEVEDVAEEEEAEAEEEEEVEEGEGVELVERKK